jgi:hypothetical protein
LLSLCVQKWSYLTIVLENIQQLHSYPQLLLPPVHKHKWKEVTCFILSVNTTKLKKKRGQFLWNMW